MKPRARRVTIGAAVLGAGVIGALMVAPGPVRDHVEAWHFQLTTDTKTIELARPSKGFEDSFLSPALTPAPRSTATIELQTYGMLALLASYSGAPVIVAVEDAAKKILWRPAEVQLESSLDSSHQLAIQVLTANGYRVLEQRLPRRAYVVIRQ